MKVHGFEIHPQAASGGKTVYVTEPPTFSIRQHVDHWRMSFDHDEPGAEHLVTPLYAGYADSVATRGFKTRTQLLERLHDAQAHYQQPGVDPTTRVVDGHQLKLMYAAEHHRLFRTWFVDGCWHVESDDSTVEGMLADDALTGYSYKLDHEVFIDYVYRALPQLKPSPGVRHIRYGVVGTGLSIVQGLSIVAPSLWNIVANGTEWIDALPMTYTDAYYELNWQTFDSVEEALSTLANRLS